ncbi:MAG: S-layer homology domain-containing protein [bacterium]|jgi:uncharacterized repeat protein (TIGR02543 family)
MKRIISIALSCILVFTLCPSVFAAGNTMTWTGSAGDGSWHTAGNWDLAQVPGDGDTAVIPESNTAEVTDDTFITLDCSGEVSVASGKCLSLSGESHLRGGKLYGDGDITITDSSDFLWSGGSIEGNGTFTVSANTRLVIETGSDVGMSRLLANNGQVMLNGGGLYFAGGGAGTGTFTVLDGAYLEFGEGVYSISGDFVNGGEMTIWDDSSVRFNAVYRQESTSTLALKVWGSGSDEYCKLDVVGAAELGGILEIDFIGEYEPQPGDTFAIMTCGSRTGEFSEIKRNMLGMGITLVPTYTDTGLTLTVSDGAEPEENVCEIDGTGYPTLDDALAGVNSVEPKTIRLLKNIDYYSGIVVEDKNITFDLNGFNLNVDNPLTEGTEKERTGLYVEGNGAVDLEGKGEFNVTGNKYGVYVFVDGSTAGNAAATVTNAAASGTDGCAAFADGENAVITVKGDATATGTGGIGAMANSSGWVTVKGNVTATADNIFMDDYDCAAVEAWDDGEVSVEGNVTATGTKSIGVLAAGSSVTVEGDITGILGGAFASVSASIEIAGNVSSTDALGFGVLAIDNCSIDVGGNVQSGGTGAVLMGVAGMDSPSEVIIGGAITAPEYISIGDDTFAFVDGVLDPINIPGYRIYTTDSSFGAVLVAEFAGGSGSEEDPYLVANADQLYNVRNHLDKHFKLIEDIDLSGYSTGKGWEPIGDERTPFTGAFDGDGHTISNLFIKRPVDPFIGLFANSGLDAKIRNVGLINVNVTGYNHVGGLAGRNRGQVTNSYATGNVTGEAETGGLVGENGGPIADSYAQGTVTDKYGGKIGGLVGENTASGTTTNCHAEVEVTVTSGNTSYGSAGGLVGYNYGDITESYAVGEVLGRYHVGGLVGTSTGTIDKSYATATVTGTHSNDTRVGGLVGNNDGSISNSFTRGAVSGEERVGGLVGYNKSSITSSYEKSSITTSYATGEVNGGSSYIGGLAGYNYSKGDLAGIITDSYWDIQTSLQASSDGGVGKSTAEMKQQATYVNWDFTDIWGINDSDNDGYPFLRWLGYEAVPTAPTVPQNFAPTSGDGQVALSWDAPASDGGSSIIKYQVSQDDGGNWTDVGLNTSHTFTGLTNDTAYTFKVRAVNSVGNGAEASVSATPTATPAPTYTVTVTNGTGGGEFEQGATVTITANRAPDGQRFKEWQVISGGITLANSQEASTSFEMPANAVAITAAYEPIPATAYTVTVNGSYAVVTGAGSYAQGATVTINAGGRSSYTFAGWTSSDGVTFTNANNATTTFTMPDKDVTITANWNYNGSSGGSSGGGSSTPTTPVAPAYKADVKAGSGAETTIPVTVDKDAGTASVDAGSRNLDQSGTIITIPSIPGVGAYSVGIPVPDLSTSDVQGTLTVNTDTGNVTVPSNMLTGVSGISGSKAEIAIGQGDKDNLPDAVKAAIGDRPLVQLTLSIDGKRIDWSNPDAPVTVSIPYTPTAAELANPEGIVIWYIDGSGKVISIPNGRYNPAAGTVTFFTTHFSYYAISYNHMSFKDVANNAWYAKAVSFIAAREITTGTGGGNFSPEARLTRGQFIVMLMKAYGIAPDANPKDNFSDAGGTYYTGYLAAAKRLGVSAGIGNNMFAPEKEITRQEMFTLLYNALKVIGKLPQGDSGKTLDHFSDAGQIDSWAKEAMTLLVKTGTIGGNAGKLNPTSTTTRAEMAQVLYNLLLK